MKINLFAGNGRQSLIVGCLLALVSLCTVSCSEDDGLVEEFTDWQNTNETYFESQYQSHAAASDTHFTLRKWSAGEQTKLDHTEYILVDVIERGEGKVTPFYGDSLNMQYVGRLLPSRSYPDGYVFDRSFSGDFDAAVLPPYKMSSYNSYGVATGSRLPTPADFVDGFSTALQNMHRGDHWRVTIPYQLAYGTETSGVIPGYSTLVFDIWLVDFWTNKKGDRQ